METSTVESLHDPDVVVGFFVLIHFGGSVVNTFVILILIRHCHATGTDITMGLSALNCKSSSESTCVLLVNSVYIFYLY